MRARGVDAWIVDMREYAEDPVFRAIVSPETVSARRRSIFVFFEGSGGTERFSLGGGSQGGLYKVIASTGTTPEGRPPELGGRPEQWDALRALVEAHHPKHIAIDGSATFPLADGLTASEADLLRTELGPDLAARLVPAEGLALGVLADRQADETTVFRTLNELTWTLYERAFSREVITPGTTRTSDVVWWLRDQLAPCGLSTWFQPTVDVQRRGMSEQRGEETLGEDPIIERGDVLHGDFGVTALRLSTDTQHEGYVLRDGETEPPPGLRAALARSNALQDLVLAELRAGSTGNEVLARVRARMAASGIDGTVYSHPIGLHGHGAGPIIGLWDMQEGVVGRGDVKVAPRTWFAIELQATSAVPEWGGQRVRSAQEEDAVVGEDGVAHWALRRQDRFHLVR
jgi:hypothetical protein